MKKLELYILSSTICIFLIVQYFGKSISSWGDVGIYINAGKSLLNSSLDEVNPEHPPLAKYIIGILGKIFGNYYVSAKIFGFASAGLMFLISWKLSKSFIASSLTLWMITFEPMFIAISNMPMLEIYMLFFELLGIWVLLSNLKWRIPMIGLFFGLAFSCKWISVVVFIGILSYLLIVKKEILQIVISLIIFVLTYIVEPIA